MTFELYSICKLQKYAYNKEHTDFRCDVIITEVDEINFMYKVMYPDGYEEYIGRKDILAGLTTAPGDFRYPIRTSGVSHACALQLYITSMEYRDFVRNNYPGHVLELEYQNILKEQKEPQQQEITTEETLSLDDKHFLAIRYKTMKQCLTDMEERFPWLVW